MWADIVFIGDGARAYQKKIKALRNRHTHVKKLGYYQVSHRLDIRIEAFSPRGTFIFYTHISVYFDSCYKF